VKPCLLVWCLAACAPPARARLEASEPPSARELQAQRRLREARCDLAWRWLYPGVGHVCLGRGDEGGAIMALATAELGATLLVARREGIEHPGATLPLVALQDLWVYGVIEPALEVDRAAGRRYVPQDSLPELLAAPFNPSVLKRPMVWGGLLATTLVVGAVVWSANRVHVDPNLFGKSVAPELGYPLGGATFATLFSHVAVAEETLFRGFAQSGLARWCGEGCGWAAGSVLFGLAHVPNALTYETSQERRDYLLYAVPVITAVGGYLGGTYWRYRYSLAPPVALHFWYDFLLSTAAFIVQPDQSVLAARVQLPF
jgi:membrane protease YdiL (CAAX protease family)